jgi:hypothetical protein
LAKNGRKTLRYDVKPNFHSNPENYLNYRGCMPIFGEIIDAERRRKKRFLMRQLRSQRLRYRLSNLKIINN